MVYGKPAQDMPLMKIISRSCEWEHPYAYSSLCNWWY